ncbi:hypothetical protein LF1_13850 [Rubripirellula obstinata]|uniref:Uncharacterized protein n=1 Tax=Rubripirellula obstinata TaxID=406547 RepID=A0A5B1CF70_9BACT|nr:hypothetical protein LF1_13850 [Rubripirellula obstinata]
MREEKTGASIDTSIIIVYANCPARKAKSDLPEADLCRLIAAQSA